MYLCVVGIDGAGKTTVINRIMDSGHEAVFTREPYNYEKMKSAVKHMPDPHVVGYSMAVDRYLHMRDVIIPAIKQGKNIISDRCYVCNLVYQSYDGVDLQWIMGIQPPNLVFPDAVIWMQSDPTIAAQRSGEDAGRLAGLQRGYSEVLNSYELPAIAWYPINVDGKSEDEVYAEVAMLVDEFDRNGRL